MRLVRLCQHRCCADKAKVPTYTQEDQTGVKAQQRRRRRLISELHTSECRDPSKGEDHKARRHDRLYAKACNQVTSKERRNEHRQNVRGDDIV